MDSKNSNVSELSEEELTQVSGGNPNGCKIRTVELVPCASKNKGTLPECSYCSKRNS